MRITYFALAALLAVTLAMPHAAFAAQLTQDQINSIVNLLNSFNADTKTVTIVQAVLNHQTPPHDGEASSTPNGMPPGQFGKMGCFKLDRDLRVGAEGDDVRNLQDILHDDPDAHFTASSTGFFGPMTAKAMMHFQMMHGIASSTDGHVGPLTRGFFMRTCGNGPDMHGEHSGTTTPPHQSE